MAIQLRNIKTISVDDSTMHDIELSAGAFFDLQTWYNLSAANINSAGYSPSLIYPFQDRVSTTSGTGPYSNFIAFPYVDEGVSTICVTHEDTWADDSTTQCKEVSGLVYNTYTAAVSTSLTTSVSSKYFTKANILILKNDETELREYDIVWDSDLLPTWKIKNSQTSNLSGIEISFSIDNNRLYAIYDFSTSVSLNSAFVDNWEIFANGYNYPFPEVNYNKHKTDVTNITGNFSGKQSILSKPLSSIGYLCSVGLSSNSGATLYNITNVFNKTSATSFSFDYITTDTSIPLLSTEIIGDTISLYVSSNSTYDYNGFVFCPNSFQHIPYSYYTADNIKPNTKIINSNNSYIDNKKQFGAIWYNFISNNTDIEINKTAAVWSENNTSYNNFQLEGLITNTDPNMSVSNLGNNKIGLSVTEGNDYWNLSGFRIDFDNAAVETSSYWKSFDKPIIGGYVDYVPLGTSKAIVWDLDINPLKTDDILKKRVYAIVDNSNNVSYNVKNIINNYKETAYDFYTPYVEVQNSNVVLNLSAYASYEIKGTRTLVNNVSSFSRLTTDIVTAVGNGYFVNSSNNENNLWTIYASGVEGDFIATINAHKTYANTEVVCSNYMSSAIELNVQNTGPDQYSLFITNPTSQSWNVSGYKITDDNISTLSVLENSSTTLKTYSPIDQYSHRAWILNSKDDNTYSAQILDYVTSPYLNNSNVKTEHIANVNTTTTSLCEYKTLTNLVPNIELNSSAVLLLSSTSYDWSVSAVDLTNEIANISYSFGSSYASTIDEIFDYIYSHPDTYNVSVSTNTNEVSSFEDFYSVDEIAPTLNLELKPVNYYLQPTEYSAALQPAFDLEDINDSFDNWILENNKYSILYCRQKSDRFKPWPAWPSLLYVDITIHSDSSLSTESMVASAEHYHHKITGVTIPLLESNNSGISGSVNYTNEANFADVNYFNLEPKTDFISTSTFIDSFSAVPTNEFVSYYENNTNQTAPYDNTLYFTTLNSKPGSYPIHNIKIDWGDDSGITHVTRFGIANAGSNTTIDVLTGVSTYNPNDVRRFTFLHEFPSTESTFNITATAWSIDTRAYDTFSLTLTGYSGITTATKRLIKSSLKSNGNMVYNIET